MSGSRREPLAIVGAGCRLPGCHGPSEYWELLAAGRDAVRATPPYRAVVRSGVDPRSARRGAGWRGALADVERFDWRAFGMSPRESRYVDPQQRLVLEASWEALEDAGLPFASVAGTRTGVYVGVMWPDYAKLLAENPDQLTGYAVPGTGLALVANRVSHCFDLRGPSVALDVQCASSLMAIHLACRSLWSAECELALAGGVNLILTPDADVMMSRAGILSKRGRCSTFDERADGFVRSEGVGIVVLKPYQRARADGDRVLALVHGSAANHDGRGESLTAPSSAGQADLIRAACADAGVEPVELDYVELHGTATQKGDPLEATALGETAGAGRRRGRPCLVGSVKTNIGHCEAAAGVASLVKVALALHRRRIPPTIGLERPNPEIATEELGLEVVTELREWPACEDAGRLPLAGVTGLSLGGGNVHVVLGAAPTAAPSETPSHGGPYLLPLSARTPRALAAMALAVAELLEDPSVPDATLGDICWTAMRRRTHHELRLAAAGRSRGQLAGRLRALATAGPVRDRALPRRRASETPVVVAPDPHDRGDVDALYERLCELYIAGRGIAWDRVQPAQGAVVSLPTYRWERERLWVDPCERALAASVPVGA